MKSSGTCVTVGYSPGHSTLLPDGSSSPTSSCNA